MISDYCCVDNNDRGNLGDWLFKSSLDTGSWRPTDDEGEPWSVSHSTGRIERQP